MVAISDTTLRHNIYETVYDLVNTAKASFGSSFSPSFVPELEGGYPDLDTTSFPIITIMPPTVDMSSFTIDTTRSVSSKNMSLVFMIFAKSNKQIDAIADGIDYTLHNNTFSGAFLTGITEDYGFVEPASQKIKLKTMTATFFRR